MTPWIQVYSNLPMTPKVFASADDIGPDSVTPETAVVGLVVKLWLWAIQNAVDGDLSECPPRLIAAVSGWTKDPKELIQLLKDNRWLDSDMKLHNWDHYAGLLIDREEAKKQKTKERVSRYRAKRADPVEAQSDSDRNAPCNAPVTPCNADGNAPCNAGVTFCNAEHEADADRCATVGCPDDVMEGGAGCIADGNAPCNAVGNAPVTPCNADGNAPVTPCNVSVTLCNAPTIHNITKPIPSSSDDDDGNARARAGKRAAVSAAVADYANRINPMASPTCLAELEAFEREMGTEVCKRAIDIAIDERKPQWSYVKGILRAKQSQGVKSIADWNELEEKRERGGTEHVKREYVKPPDIPGALY